MSSAEARIADFLAQKRIAIAGVSRNRSGETANAIYGKLRGLGYEVIPVNPNTSTAEGVACYPNVQSIPGGVDAVLIVTRPRTTEEIVRQCAEAGVRRVWMHRSFGQGSVSDRAAEFCQERGIAVIAGGCPMMYCRDADIGHRCMRWVLRFTGGLPE